MLATFTYLTGPKKGESEKIEGERISIGRAPNNRLRFPDAERRVSAHHAEIRLENDRFVLRDLGSTNGTMVNGRRVKAAEIHADDLIEFGAGGPLLRFSAERVEQTEGYRNPPALDESRHDNGASHRPGETTVERIVDRAVRNRTGNTRLIAALVLAMMIGAAGGVLLSTRYKQADDGQLSISEVAALNGQAVVFIRAEFELIDGTGQVVATDARTGTGFLVSPGGLIATNRHLVRDWEYNPKDAEVTGRIRKIEVVLPGHLAGDAIPATIAMLSSDKNKDVAILKIPPRSDISVVHALEPDLARSNQGEEVVVISYPLGLDLLELTHDTRVAASLSIGVVSRVSQEWIQLDLRAYNGSSGGPVLNRRGEVIGILTANIGSAQDITLSTPIGEAMELIAESED